AKVKRGEIISETILLMSNDYNNRVSHVKVIKNEQMVHMEVIDIDGISIFEAKEKTMLGSQPEYLNRLNISSKYIDAYKLY
ncbi:MAG: hypothetical protein ABJI22_01685, partial [Maribacter sp.]